MPLTTRVWGAGKLLVLAAALVATYVIFATASMRLALRAREVQIPDLTNRTANDASADPWAPWSEWAERTEARMTALEAENGKLQEHLLEITRTAAEAFAILVRMRTRSPDHSGTARTSAHAAPRGAIRPGQAGRTPPAPALPEPIHVRS